jgi:ABC-type phosphate/phosphonate transport system substrate-binding protein
MSIRERIVSLPRVTIRRSVALLLIALALARPASAQNDALVLLIQPLPRDERSAATYQPLAQYLEALTGRRCVVQTPPNFPAYWDVLRRNNYDLAFDGPHFTDYRSNKFGFSALVKTPDSVSYSLIVRESARLHDPLQLIGRRIASLGMLSSGATRLNAMYPSAARQPVLVEVQSADGGIELLLDKRVEAAFLPTTVVSERLQRGGISVILTTEPMARLVLSVSPRMGNDVKEKIRDGLLQATSTDAGRAMLRSVGLERFEPVTPESFANQRNVLKSYWGY